MSENSPLTRYRALERSLVRIRLRTNGKYSPEEESITERMTALWNELTTEEQDMLSAEGPQALNTRGGDYPMKVPLWLTTPPEDDWPEEARDTANYETMERAWDPLVDLILPFLDREKGLVPGYFLRYSFIKFAEMVDDNEHPVIDVTLLPESKIPKNAVKVGKYFFTYVGLRYRRLLLRAGGGDETALIEQMDEAYKKLTPEETQLVQSQGAWKFSEDAHTPDPMTKYRALVAQLASLREANSGNYCPEEGPLLDEMTALWNTFTDSQCDIAYQLMKTIPKYTPPCPPRSSTP